MKFSRPSCILLAGFFLIGTFAVSAFGTCPQDEPKLETLQAQAMGQSTSVAKQFGSGSWKLVNVMERK
jgi:hypothetical protein